jgi:hypothetical protein
VDQLARQHQSVQLATKGGKAGCLDLQLFGSALARMRRAGLIFGRQTEAFIFSFSLSEGFVFFEAARLLQQRIRFLKYVLILNILRLISLNVVCVTNGILPRIPFRNVALLITARRRSHVMFSDVAAQFS